MGELEDTLRTLVRSEVRVGVAEALEEAQLRPEITQPEEGWRSRLHRVHAETRLSLSEVAEALGVSERTVRRYLDGDGARPELPHQRGPTGLTVRAGDLVTWIEDVEGANRFRRGAA